MGKNQHDLKRESDLARTGRPMVLYFGEVKVLGKDKFLLYDLVTTLLLLVFAWLHTPCSLRKKSFISAKLAGSQSSRNAGCEI